MPSRLSNIDNGHHFNDGVASFTPPSSRSLQDIAPLRQIWPRVHLISLRQGHCHDNDCEHRLRYALYLINGYPLPEQPIRDSPKHEPSPSPLCQKSTTKSASKATSPNLLIPPSTMADDQPHVEFSLADTLLENLQNMQISNPHEPAPSTIRSTFVSKRAPFVAFVLPGPPAVSLSSSSHREARWALLGADPFFDMDQKWAKAQEFIRNYKNFRQKLEHGLEREKEHHLEDIIARIAPGPQDAGYRAPLATHTDKDRRCRRRRRD